MMDRLELAAAARVLNALAHPVRLGVIQALQERPMTISELTEEIGCGQSMMSQQVAKLEAQGLVASRRDGVRKICDLRNPDFLKMLECLQRHLVEVLAFSTRQK